MTTLTQAIALIYGSNHPGGDKMPISQYVLQDAKPNISVSRPGGAAS